MRTTRRATTILALMTSAAFMAGISPALAEDIRLDFWTEFTSAPELPVLEQIVKDFNAANPGIQVVHTGFENTPYETTLKTSFAGGNPADIVELNGGANMFQYAEAGGLLDLTEFVTSKKELIAPGLESWYQFGGKSYGVPLGLSIGNLLWYNKDMLAEKGVDPSTLNTWDGLLAAAQKFKDAGVDPIAFGNSEGWPGNHLFNHLILRLLGPDDYIKIALQTFDKSVSSEKTWSSPESVKAWELYKGLLDKGFFTAGYLSDDYPTASNLFLTGKAPFFSMGSWFLGNIESTAPKGPFGVIAFPSVEGAPGKQTDLVTNGLVVTITAASKHPEEAKKFLDYLTSEPVQKKWSEATQRLLPYTYDTSTWAYSDRAKEVATLLSKATNSVAFLDMIEDQTCNVPWVWNASQGILTGDLTPQSAGKEHDTCVTELRETKGF
ncbi:MAG: sugar ABC transporter substrate-binding protein [Rhizobium sp.]|nr:sugar ABC transporter substrate-binding protein [Rhizobium sp.]